MAWGVVDPESKKAPDPRLAQLALRAARRADELTKGENMALLDTLACALYRTGDFAGAIAAEEKAIRRLEAEDKDRKHPYFKMFEDRVATFRKAAGEGAGKP